MCELFAMSSRIPTKVGFTLERLACRGSTKGRHCDGWGVAFYEEHDLLLLREARAAAESELVQSIEQHAPSSQLVISHIRRATQGKPALRNTHPFLRELGGCIHVFAHNGDLAGIGHQQNFVSGRFKPVGDTDSELVFCSLLDQLSVLWDGAGERLPPQAARLEIVAAFAAELRAFGTANFLYADGDVLFVHSHRRMHEDGRAGPPGLHVLEYSLEEPSSNLSVSGISLTTIRQEMALVASVPLTQGPWQPLAEGEVVSILNGKIIERCPA